MSWDLTIIVDDNHECRHVEHDWNYTHNTNPMIRAAGLDAWASGVDGMACFELERRLRRVLFEFDRAPSRFRAMNPPNGWGDFDRLRDVLREIADVCQEHPMSTVQVWA